MELPILLRELKIGDIFFINNELYELEAILDGFCVCSDMVGEVHKFSPLDIVKILPF